MADCIQNVIKIGCENYGECIIPPLPPEDGNLVGYDDIDDIKHIHHSIPQQMATFLNLDYNRLVEFLKAYWKWAEMPHTPYFNLKNHLDILNFEYKVFEYLDLMKDEYLYGFPSEIRLRQVLDILIRYSRDIHASGGTEAYTRFLYNLLIDKNQSGNSEIVIFYPSNNILRTSYGKWIENDEYIYLTNIHNFDKSDVKYIELKQEIVSRNGNLKIVKAIVTDAVAFTNGIYSGLKVKISDSNGEFDINFPIKIGESIEYIYPITEANITLGGSGYTTTNTIVYNGSDYFEVLRESTKGEINLNISGSLTKSNIKVFDSAGIQITNFTFANGIIKSNLIEEFSWYTIRLDVQESVGQISSVDDKGAITKIVFNNPSIGTDTNFEIIASGVEPAVVQFNQVTSNNINGYFKNHDGFLSDKDVLQDSYYYQDFSYEVIITVDDMTNPNDVVLDGNVPSGMLGFKRIKMVGLACTQMNAIIDGYQYDSKSESLFINENDLYSRYKDIEDLKHTYNTKSVQVTSFLNVMPYDNINIEAQTEFNTHDSIIKIDGWEYNETTTFTSDNRLYSKYGEIDTLKFEFNNGNKSGNSLPYYDFCNVPVFDSIVTDYNGSYNVHDSYIYVNNPTGLMPVEHINKYIEITKNNCRLSQKVMEGDIGRLTDYIWIMYDNTLLDDDKFNKFGTKPIVDFFDIMANSVKLDKRD